MRFAKKVLVVDDKYYIRQLVMTALGLKGYTVFAAADGREGFEVARRERPDVILLDLLMPGMDGYELLRRIRASRETAATPVVIMSARSDIEAGTGILQEVNDYLPKPFDLELLYSVVGRHTSAGLADESPVPLPADRSPAATPSAAVPSAAVPSALGRPAEGEVAAARDPAPNHDNPAK